MRLLDVGCGPGTITVGLARAVAPGEALGIECMNVLSSAGDQTGLGVPKKRAIGAQFSGIVHPRFVTQIQLEQRVQ